MAAERAVAIFSHTRKFMGLRRTGTVNLIFHFRYPATESPISCSCVAHFVPLARKSAKTEKTESHSCNDKLLPVFGPGLVDLYSTAQRCDATKPTHLLCQAHH